MTRKPDEWMPLHVRKYLGDTMRLTRDQHGAYLLLLMDYWMTGEALPDDDGQLAAVCKATPSEWKRLRKVLEPFFQIEDGKWVQKRAEEELVKARSMVAAKSKAGKEGAAKRWHKDDAHNGTGMADASHSHRQADAPSTTNLNPSSLRSEGARPIEDVCKAFGINLTDDVRRLDWPGQLGEMLSGGLSLSDDILPACAEARKRKIINLQWVRKRAESEKARRGIAAQPIADEFAQTDETGWKGRMRVFREKGMWAPKWGPKPGEHGCKCPEDILTQQEAA